MQNKALPCIQHKKMTSLLSKKPIVTFKNFIDDREAICDIVRGKSYIYLLTNNITGQIYIGQSTKGHRRMLNYLLESINPGILSKRNSVVWENIKEYGLEHFSFTLVEIVGKNIKKKKITDEDILMQKKLNALELHYINHYTRISPKLILNTRGKSTYILNGVLQNKYESIFGQEKVIDLDFTPIWLKDPIFLTKDMLSDRDLVKKDTNGRTIIYGFVILYTGETYIGSSINGWERVANYYRLSRKDKTVVMEAIRFWGHNNVLFGILEDFGLKVDAGITQEQLRFFEQAYINKMVKIDLTKSLNEEGAQSIFLFNRIREEMKNDHPELYSLYEDIKSGATFPIAGIDELRSAGNIPDAILYHYQPRLGKVYLYEVKPNGEQKFIEVINSITETAVKLEISKMTVNRYTSPATKYDILNKDGRQYRLSKIPLHKFID